MLRILGLRFCLRLPDCQDRSFKCRVTIGRRRSGGMEEWACQEERKE
jgi:hypothetical protein